MEELLKKLADKLEELQYVVDEDGLDLVIDCQEILEKINEL